MLTISFTINIRINGWNRRFVQFSWFQYEDCFMPMLELSCWIFFYFSIIVKIYQMRIGPSQTKLTSHTRAQMPNLPKTPTRFCCAKTVVHTKLPGTKCQTSIKQPMPKTPSAAHLCLTPPLFSSFGTISNSAHRHTLPAPHHHTSPVLSTASPLRFPRHVRHHTASLVTSPKQSLHNNPLSSSPHSIARAPIATSSTPGPF